jgi:hypothetical protein
VKIQLQKEYLLSLYCHARQADRSIDRVLGLGGSWDALRDYYQGRLSALRAMHSMMEQLVPGRTQGAWPGTRDQVCRSLPGAISLLLRHCTARWRRAWTFPEQEVCFIAETLGSLLETLEALTRPDTPWLVGLRMDLWACTYIIECRCKGLPELALANRIEHFNHPDSLPHVELAEVLRTAAGPEKAVQRIRA